MLQKLMLQMLLLLRIMCDYHTVTDSQPNFLTIIKHNVTSSWFLRPVNLVFCLHNILALRTFTISLSSPLHHYYLCQCSNCPNCSSNNSPIFGHCLSLYWKLPKKVCNNWQWFSTIWNLIPIQHVWKCSDVIAEELGCQKLHKIAKPFATFSLSG